MTWVVTDGRLSEEDRAKFLAARAKVEADIRALALKPVGKSAAAVRFRQEDLIALAKKIKGIDKKLGREVS
jgi:hypothetical protein